MIALLSINPEHIENIFSGKKRFEYRRKIFSKYDVKTILMYSTRPVQRLVGMFSVLEIVHASPNDLWRSTHINSGISKEFFDSYFQGSTSAFAIRIGRVVKFDVMVDPFIHFENFYPPQSFRYISDEQLRADWFP